MHHPMSMEDSNGVEILLVCDKCGRRIVIGAAGKLTVIDEGDFFALHAWASPGTEVTAHIEQ